jgi:mycothiol synthase
LNPLSAKESGNIMSKKDFTIRNYHPDDFAAYVQLHLDAEKRDQTGKPVSQQMLAEALGHPRFRPENNLFIAEHNGSIIGYISVFLEPGLGRALIDGLIHPSQRHKGAATRLLKHALRHATEAGLKVAQTCISESNEAARRLLKQLGFEYIRFFCGFRLDLTTAPLPDIDQQEYIIGRLKPGEAQDLTEIQNTAFAESWGFNPNTTEEIRYRISLGSCSAKDIVMAYRKTRPVAYCWTRLLGEKNPESGDTTGEIHMLGVAPAFRRKGLGRMVLTAGLSHLKGRGVTLVVLTADGEDHAARRLYESVGFEEWTKTNWYEKKLACDG